MKIKAMKKELETHMVKLNLYSLDDITRIYSGHYFSKGSTSFFNSRYSQEIVCDDKACYFITSEKFDDNSPRLYSIRRYDVATKTIDTIGEFQAYDTKTKAFNDAVRYAYNGTLRGE